MTYEDAIVHMANGRKVRHSNQFYVYELTNDNRFKWTIPRTGSWGYIKQFPEHMVTSESWQLL